ncbi:MAG: hypothetical protein IPL01_08725 [Acidobacteria bacterium]|nr:hypothetical protein [Acidobacteriota bacterium]
MKPISPGWLKFTESPVKRIDMIQKAWAEQKAVKGGLSLFLQSHAVSTHFAVKIFKQYGNDSITVVEKALTGWLPEVYGIGFRTADQIARNLGIAFDATEGARSRIELCPARRQPMRTLLSAGRRADPPGIKKFLKSKIRERIGSVLEKLPAEGLLVGSLFRSQTLIKPNPSTQSFFLLSGRLKNHWPEESGLFLAFR